MTRHVAVDILIPPLGDGSIDCQLSQWLASVGDFVKEGEPLLILETEKTAIEIPAPADGTLAEVYVFEGEEVIESERVGVIRAEAFDDEEDLEEDDEEFDDLDDEDEEDDDEDEDDYEVEEDDDDYDEDDDEEDEEFDDEDEDYDA
ncbi:MAG TPA: lipoyl domain-containing protein [bacterium]|nr:lipoyl domain-containing protein [bacterium]